MRRTSLLSVFITLTIPLSGCAVDFNTIARLDPRIHVTIPEPVEEEMHTITIGESLCKISDTSLDKLKANFTNIDENMYSEIASDGESITLSLNDEQLEKWRTSYRSMIDTVKTDFGNESEKFRMIVSDDYGTVDFYCNSDLAKVGLMNYIRKTRINIGMYQILSGVIDAEVSIKINIYSSDTAQLIQSLSTFDAYRYSDDAWNIRVSEE